MTAPHPVLTPDALVMVDTIARTGSFAAAARELGRVPSSLSYSVRQLEEALDVLLFDRSSRQAQLTAAGLELVSEGRRLLAEMEAVAQRVRRVASGWESQLTLAVDGVVNSNTLWELCEAFYAHMEAAKGSTRLRLRTEVLAGTWEALQSGQADLAIGVALPHAPPSGMNLASLGEIEFVYAVAPHHPLAAHPSPISDAELLRHRAVAVADSARHTQAFTVNLLPGQDVLTVPSLAAKLQAQARGLGGGFLPESLARPLVQSGRLVLVPLERPRLPARFGYAWRGPKTSHGLALSWWLQALAHPETQAALLQGRLEPN